MNRTRLVQTALLTAALASLAGAQSVIHEEDFEGVTTPLPLDWAQTSNYPPPLPHPSTTMPVWHLKSNASCGSVTASLAYSLPTNVCDYFVAGHTHGGTAISSTIALSPATLVRIDFDYILDIDAQFFSNCHINERE